MAELPDRRLTRRHMLGGAAIAGAGAFAAMATGARPAAASSGTLSYGQANHAGSSPTSIDSSAVWDGANFIPTSATLVVTNDTGSALVAGKSGGANGCAIEAVAQGGTAALSATATDPATVAITTTHLGNGAALSATCNSISYTGPAVMVESDGGIGIQVLGGPGGAIQATAAGSGDVVSAVADVGSTGAALSATVNEPASTATAVRDTHNGTGTGVAVVAINGAIDARSTTAGTVVNAAAPAGSKAVPMAATVSEPTSPAIGVNVNTYGTGTGVSVGIQNTTSAASVIVAGQRGTGKGVYARIVNLTNRNPVVHGLHDGPGTGVMGQAGAGGIGGYFSGGVANIRLGKSAATTHPTTGTTGDLFVDRSGRLWYCISGKTWKQLA